MPDLNDPFPIPPLSKKKNEVPIIDMKLQSEVIKIGVLTESDEQFLKTSGIGYGKNFTKLFPGGPETQMILVADIHNMRMTVCKGDPTLIFHRVPEIGDVQTWTLRFSPQLKEPYKLRIHNSDELRCLAKAIVSGYFMELKRGFLNPEGGEYGYSDMTEFPVYNEQLIEDWPSKLAAKDQEIQRLYAELNNFKKKEVPPLSTQTDIEGPPKPPQPPLPIVGQGVANLPSEKHQNKRWLWIFVAVVALVITIIFGALFYGWLSAH